MTTELVVRKIGNSTGLIFPKEVLSKLHLSEGDTVFVTDTPDGGVRLSAYNPAFAKAMKAYERTSSKYRNALHELAQ